MRTPAATHSRQGRALERSLTLLRVFLVASAGILLVAGLVLGAELSHALKAQALDDAKSSVVSYVDGVVGPSVVRAGRVRVACALERSPSGLGRSPGKRVGVHRASWVRIPPSPPRQQGAVAPC